MVAKMLTTFLVMCTAETALSSKYIEELVPANTEEIWLKITTMVSTFNDFNFSIIAWQNVYNKDGNITEVFAIELNIPVQSNKSTVFVDNTDDENPHKVLKQFSSFMDENSQDFFTEISNEKWKNDGTLKSSLYWNSEMTYYNKNGLVIFNRTQRVSKEYVQDFKKCLGNTYLEPIVLEYDIHGIFDLEKSSVTGPSVVAYVVDFWKVSDQIILESPKILVDVIVRYSNQEIPEQLAKSYDKKFTEYDWRVIINPGLFHLKADMWIQLSTDAFNFYDGQKDVYMVYGVLRTINN